jgi:hypothetical protein
MPSFLLLVLVLSTLSLANTSSQADFQNLRAQGNATNSVRAGRALFAGDVRFQNGGPPCAACHATSGLPFPNGGSLGPDLSRAASRLGPEGIEVALQTLYFPTMRPIFDGRPLTIPEQRDVKAFLDQAQGRPLPPAILPVMAGIAFCGLLIFLALTWGIWRHRVRGIRRPLVKSASAGAAQS